MDTVYDLLQRLLILILGVVVCGLVAVGIMTTFGAPGVAVPLTAVLAGVGVLLTGVVSRVFGIIHQSLLGGSGRSGLVHLLSGIGSVGVLTPIAHEFLKGPRKGSLAELLATDARLLATIAVAVAVVPQLFWWLRDRFRS